MSKTPAQWAEDWKRSLHPFNDITAGLAVVIQQAMAQAVEEFREKAENEIDATVIGILAKKIVKAVIRALPNPYQSKDAKQC